MPLAALLALGTPALAAPPIYHVVNELKSVDGGWDLLSVDPADRRLYVARSDAVTAVDLTTGAVTDRLAPAQRGHAALAIPGTHELIVTNGNADNAIILFDGRTSISEPR